MDNETIAGYDGLIQGGAAPSPDLDRLVEQITPENLPDAEPQYTELDIQEAAPRPNAEIRLERLERKFAELLDRIDRYNSRASHRI
jgi:hypothetical protein